MASRIDRKQKTDGSKYSDDYYAKQWAEQQKREDQRSNDFIRWWLEWQKRAEGRARYSAWLVVPSSLTDYGMRPLPTGMPFWASPFIGVNSPDASGQPLAGAPNIVWARVFNLGAATAAPTMVRFYWADPSVGLGAADAHLIGQVMVEVPPMSSVMVNCPTPWVPTYVNNGHECLFVSADNQMLDPLQVPFQPWADRHVGQRNEQVLPAVAQAMRMWLPGGLGAMTAELRVLALRVGMPTLPLKHTVVATLNQVADHVLSGFGPVNPKIQAGGRPFHRVERIDTDAVIASYRVSDETRSLRERSPALGATVDDPQVWGEALLRVQTVPMAQQQLRIEFKTLDLSREDFVVLHFAWLAGGMIHGGYTITLAHPGWFKPGPIQPPDTGGNMDTSAGKHELRDLVIRHNPQARATLEIAEQLASYLPIESARQLSHGVKVAGSHVPGHLIAQLGESLFPIRTTDELVARVAAMLRIFASHAAANRASLSADSAKLLDYLEGHGDQPTTPVLVARGKPLFSVPREKEA